MANGRKAGRVVICGCGFKGRRFVEFALAHWNVAAVFTYTQGNVAEDSAAEIHELCKTHGVKSMESKHPDFSGVGEFDICFLVGWQFMLPQVDDRVVVFHDSVLPRYRGFNPTVGALVKGEKQIGVTALLPSSEMDAGPILGQEAIEVDYPMTLKRAFEELTQGYIRIADTLVDAVQKHSLRAIAMPQDESKATYSTWRHREDQRIDWHKDNHAVQRLVDAVSWPYTGAYTVCDGQEIIIHEVAIAPEIIFEDRHPGKFWTITDNQPLVVCGSGMIRILRATLPDGTPVTFNRMRVCCV